MAVTLPTSPAPRSMTPRLVSRRRDLEPTFSGPTTRVRRLGSRWSVDVEMPPMTYESAMTWIAALTSAEADTVILRLPQPGFDTGSPGTPLVNGASQLGATINLDGFTVGYLVKAGQWLNLTAAGRSYLYQAVADRYPSDTGVMPSLGINPMIRRSPADNSAVEFATPAIEGFLSGRETMWTVDVARTVGLAFTVTERE
jgi:hypothetical protein